MAIRRTCKCQRDQDLQACITSTRLPLQGLVLLPSVGFLSTTVLSVLPWKALRPFIACLPWLKMCVYAMVQVCLHNMHAWAGTGFATNHRRIRYTAAEISSSTVTWHCSHLFKFVHSTVGTFHSLYIPPPLCRSVPHIPRNCNCHLEGCIIVHH